MVTTITGVTGFERQKKQAIRRRHVDVLSGRLLVGFIQVSNERKKGVMFVTKYMQYHLLVSF